MMRKKSFPLYQINLIKGKRFPKTKKAVPWSDALDQGTGA